MPLIDWKETSRDLAVTIALIGAFITLMWIPFNIFFAFLHYFNTENPELIKANFWVFHEIFWGGVMNMPFGSEAVCGFFLGIAFFAHRAKSIVRGFLYPMLIFIAYEIIAVLFFSYIPFFFSSWYASIILIIITTIPLYFFVQKYCGKDLNLTYTFTEKLYLLSSVIIPQILNAFVISMDAETIYPFYGIKVFGWPGQ